MHLWCANFARKFVSVVNAEYERNTRAVWAHVRMMYGTAHGHNNSTCHHCVNQVLVPKRDIRPECTCP